MAEVKKNWSLNKVSQSVNLLRSARYWIAKADDSSVFVGDSVSAGGGFNELKVTRWSGQGCALLPLDPPPYVRPSFRYTLFLYAPPSAKPSSFCPSLLPLDSPFVRCSFHYTLILYVPPSSRSSFCPSIPSSIFLLLWRFSCQVYTDLSFYFFSLLTLLLIYDILHKKKNIICD